MFTTKTATGPERGGKFPIVGPEQGGRFPVVAPERGGHFPVIGPERGLWRGGSPAATDAS